MAKQLFHDYIWRCYNLRATIELIGLGATICGIFALASEWNTMLSTLGAGLGLATIMSSQEHIRALRKIALYLDDNCISSRLLLYIKADQDYKIIIWDERPKRKLIMCALSATRMTNRIYDHNFRSDSSRNVLFGFSRDKSFRHRCRGHVKQMCVSCGDNCNYIHREDVPAGTIHIQRGKGWQFHFTLVGRHDITVYKSLPMQTCWFSEYHRNLFAFNARTFWKSPNVPWRLFHRVQVISPWR